MKAKGARIYTFLNSGCKVAEKKKSAIKITEVQSFIYTR